MLEKFGDWIRKNVECCACGGTLETSSYVNVVELKKRATWKFPVIGQIDIPGYEPRAMSIVCDECQQKKVKIQRCIEWEGTPSLLTYHNVDDLEDVEESMSLMNYLLGKLYRQRIALKAAKQESGN